MRAARCGLWIVAAAWIVSPIAKCAKREQVGCYIVDRLLYCGLGRSGTGIDRIYSVA